MKPLHPIMAALLAASVGTLSLRTPAFGTVADPAAKPVETDAKNTVNVLSEVLKSNGGARADAQKRIEEFLLGPDDQGKRFVAAQTDEQGLASMVKTWVKEAGMGPVADLYFAVGPGAASPGWALNHPDLSKTFVPGAKWERCLRNDLKEWTTKDQIGRSQEARAAAAFLNHAASRASAVLGNCASKEQTGASVAANDTTEVAVPTGVRGGRGGLAAVTTVYTSKDLYRDGAVSGPVFKKGDDGPREISIKIYTTRDEKGALVNQIGVFDVSDPRDPIGQRFDFTAGEKTFILDDRASDNRKYNLIVKNGEIFFGRPGAKPGEEGTLSTTIDELMLKRADQAARLNTVFSVGGQDFYGVPQGGKTWALALFPVDKIDARARINPLELRPDLYADIGERNSEGLTVDIPYEKGYHLGSVEGKEYHLERKNGVLAVVEGPGDKPKPKTDAKPKGDEPAGDKGRAGRGGSSAGEKSPADIVQDLLEKNVKCKKPQDSATAELDEDLKGKYGVISCLQHDNKWALFVLVPKKDAEGQQLIYQDPSGKMRGRFYKHYLALESESHHEYLDLTQHAKGKDVGFQSAGTVTFEEDGKGKAANMFSDKELLVDILKRHMGLAEEDGAKIKQRVTKHAGDGAYTMFANVGEDGLLVAMNAGPVWREVFPADAEMRGKDRSTPGNKDLYARAPGPGNIFEGGVSSDDAPFPKTLDLDAAHKAEAINEKSDIVLYKSVADPKANKEDDKYYLMFKIKSPDKGKEMVFRTKHFEIFSSAEKGRHLPANYGMAGLVELGDVIADRSAAGFGFVPGSKAERGVLAVLQNLRVPSENAKNKGANCAGPIFWWGVADREAALKICKDDKF